LLIPPLKSFIFQYFAIAFALLPSAEAGAFRQFHRGKEFLQMSLAFMA